MLFWSYRSNRCTLSVREVIDHMSISDTQRFRDLYRSLISHHVTSICRLNDLMPIALEAVFFFVSKYCDDALAVMRQRIFGRLSSWSMNQTVQRLVIGSYEWHSASEIELKFFSKEKCICFCAYINIHNIATGLTPVGRTECCNGVRHTHTRSPHAHFQQPYILHIYTRKSYS